MTTLIRKSVTATSLQTKVANSTRPYQNLLTFLDLPEPLFVAIIAAATLLLLLTCCLVTSRFFCKGCFLFHNPKFSKKRNEQKQDINALLLNELEDFHGYGTIDFSLGYKVESQILRVKVIRASDLPASIDGSLDPYVIVMTNSKSNNEEKKTKIKMENDRPFFNQKFQFKILKSELEDSSVTFKVLDYDKFGADALLGQLTVQIKDLNTSSICRGDMEFSKSLAEGEDILQGMGQVCIILNHSKTGLVVTILEAKNLRIKEDSNYSFVFIKIKYQIQKLPTKYVTKVIRETKKVPISQFPYFNEVFMFQSFNVPLCNCRVKVKVFVSGRFKMPACIGYVLLGSNVTSNSSQVHWESMLDNPRHPVAKWHILVSPSIRE